jgi:signal peptidase I
MEPTLPDGSTYLLDQFYWKLGGIRRDDIVVVRHREEKWVKRLIGMPGDVLQLEYGRRGWIVRLDNLTVNPALRRDAPNVVVRSVGPDEIFVIGDNLNHSADSTNQEAGAFLLGDIIGVVRTFTFRREFPFPRRAVAAS